MMYEIVHFSGLSVTERDIFNPRYSEGVIPADWTRISMKENLSISSNKKWIEQNLTGKYSIYRTLGRTNLFFEEKTSAVLYKLLDGDKCGDENIT